MLADRQHADAAGRSVGVGNEFRHRRHVAVFHRHPQKREARAKGRGAFGVGGIDEQRLFDQHRQRPDRRDLLQLADMAEVGAGDQSAIDVGRGKQIGNRRRRTGAGRQPEGLVPHAFVRLENGGNARRRDEADIADMLLAHHATADDAVAE